MEWEKDGLNYWENEDCPIDYLRRALSNLIELVEGTYVAPIHFTPLSREKIVETIAFYEEVADK